MGWRICSPCTWSRARSDERGSGQRSGPPAEVDSSRGDGRIPGTAARVLIGGFALAPMPPSHRLGQATDGDRVFPPSASEPSPSLRSSSRAPQATETPIAYGRSSATQSAHPRRRVGSPERPPSPHSSRGAILGVARRFAVAYMPDQIGMPPHRAQTAIERTCTPVLASYLLAHPALPTPQVAAHRDSAETDRVASVNVAPGVNTAKLNYGSGQDTADAGVFVVTLVTRPGGWLVADLEL